MKHSGNDNWMGLGGQPTPPALTKPSPEKDAAAKVREYEKNFQPDMTPEEMKAIREKNFGPLRARPPEPASRMDLECPHGKPACIDCILKDEKKL